MNISILTLISCGGFGIYVSHTILMSHVCKGTPNHSQLIKDIQYTDVHKHLYMHIHMHTWTQKFINIHAYVHVDVDTHTKLSI